MIDSIFGVDSVKGSGKITFRVTTDAGGCDEDCSTTLEGQRFATHVKLGPNANSPQSISHTKSGDHIVTVKAETSNVQSESVDLDL